MNINYKEAQFEFFPNSGGTPDETKRPHFMAARFTLSIENLVIFSIVSIMVVIFTFSLGVERGKRVALRDGAGRTAGADVSPAAGGAADSAVLNNAVQKTPSTGSRIPVVELTKIVDPAVSPVKVSAAALPPQDAARKSTGGFTVQIASYKSEKSAQKEALVLQKKGLKAFVLPKGQHIVLCVGNFQKREEASIYGKKLKSNYQDFVVRRL